MRNAIIRRLPCATLFAWAGLLLYFYASGRLSAFLIPMFRPWVLVAGLVILALAIAALIAPDKITCCDDGEANCGHPMGRRTSGKLLTFFVLLVPVAAAAGLSRDGFSRTTIENRGIIVDATGLGREGPSIEGRVYEPPLPVPDGVEIPLPSEEDFFDPSDYLPRTPEGYIKSEVIDYLYAANEPILRQDFEGETVEVIGQIMPENDNNANGRRFKLVRMFMSCCAADARPVGVVVESEAPPELPDMTWVRVVGRADFPIVNGRNTAIVKAQSVEATDPPQETMLY